MAISVNANDLVAGPRRLPIQQVPHLVELHLAKVEGTQALEASGLLLRGAGFDSERLPEFIREVCKWGGYAGIAGRVLKNNSLETIRSRFVKAVAALEAGGDPSQRNVEALQAVNELHGLGRPSFATKQLRFLYPKLCPILDSRVAANFGYPISPAGYRRYSDACIRTAAALGELGIRNPVGRPDGDWFAADVDLAVFALIAPWSTDATP